MGDGNSGTILKRMPLIPLLLAGCLYPGISLGYIGPGAGIAFASSFFFMFIAILVAILVFLFWPFRSLYIAIKRRKRGYKKTDIDRVVILGLDGLDPALCHGFLKQGKLPNLQKVAEKGCFHPLATTFPSMSPVAWSSFSTGVDASRHNIFDFLNRDVKTYMPDLSSVRVEGAKRVLSLGKYRLPIGKPRTVNFKKSRSFWSILGDYYIFSTILRVPITFPPDKFNGALLSAMCVPDLKGTQGSFTFYTSNPEGDGKHTGGVRIPVKVENDTVSAHIPGPPNSLTKTGEELSIPFRAKINRADRTVAITVDKDNFTLKPKEYSPWITLKFKAGMGIKVQGIARFYIMSIEPDFQLYITPINIDPGKPALAISHPDYYATCLAKIQGSYATLGLAEDTWALNERVIDEEAFLKQAYLNHAEREEMFFNALGKTPRGVCACVFDATDRIQHMFYRYLVDDHPANRDKDREKHKNAIEELYMKMDDLVGRTFEKLDDKTVFIVMSDHGFKSFDRALNLNTWLYENGYLFYKNGNPGDWFQDVDWEKTRAYTFGLTGIYLNLRGREAKGIVDPKDEAPALRKELHEKLEGLMDEEKNRVAIRTVYETTRMFDGPYVGNGPDLIIGYNIGYRASWEAAVGNISEKVIDDNTRSWSGDHCIDPKLVPGVFFSNRKITTRTPNIMDVAPSVLDLFGVKIPAYMKGTRLFSRTPE